MEKTYTLKEIAEQTGVSVITWRNYISAGLVPAVKLGRLWRITANDLEQFLKTGVQKGYYVQLYPSTSYKARQEKKALEKS